MRNFVFILAFFYVACSTTSKIDSDIFKNEISKYHLLNGDTLLDIGSGDGTNDKIIFRFYPKMFFILEDIDLKYLTQDKLSIVENGKKKYFKDWCQKIIGTADTIPVASNKYKNVLCRITLHEFTNRDKMISEFKRILTNDGQLIIIERIPKYEGEIDEVCKRKLLSKTEIIETFTANGFKLLSVDSTNYSRNRFGGNGNIFRFSE